MNPEDLQDEEKLLYERYRFVVDPGQSLLRIDKYLMSRIENASRTKIQAAALNGNIIVNDEAVKAAYKVKPGDRISIMMEDPIREIELIPQNIPMDIVYEDDQVIVVNKPAGMVVHPAYGNYSGTLVNALMYHLNMDSAESENPRTPYLVHRIDKDTSGLLIVAKNDQAQIALQKQFFDHTTERKYLALVWGDLKDDEGTISGNIARSKNDRKVFRVYEDEEVGKHAITHFKVVERFGYVTLVECELETGRTHQIRVHFRYIKHPLFNDETYGGDSILRGTTFSKYQQFVKNCFAICPRQALHAQTLGFRHPVSGETLRFSRELPEDMQQLIEKWRKYAVHKALGNVE